MIQNDDYVFGNKFYIYVHDVLGSFSFDDFELDDLKMKDLVLIS